MKRSTFAGTALRIQFDEVENPKTSAWSREKVDVQCSRCGGHNQVSRDVLRHNKARNQGEYVCGPCGHANNGKTAASKANLMNVGKPMSGEVLDKIAAAHHASADFSDVPEELRGRCDDKTILSCDNCEKWIGPQTYDHARNDYREYGAVLCNACKRSAGRQAKSKTATKCSSCGKEMFVTRWTAARRDKPRYCTKCKPGVFKKPT